MSHHATRIPAVIHRAIALEVRTEGLPAGICGQVQGIALTYGVTDYYGTQFQPGCLDRTKSEKLAAGKVKLLSDHNGVTGCHVGVVRSLDTVGDAELMSADVFDTAAGRSALEYLRAVVASKAFTGLSIGFYDRASEFVKSDEEVDGPYGPMSRGGYQLFTEVELDEISLTPSPAVPGAEVTGTRNAEQKRTLLRTALGTLIDGMDETEVRALFAARFGTTAPVGAPVASQATLPSTDTSAAAPASGDASTGDSRSTTATMDERLRAVRQSFAH